MVLLGSLAAAACNASLYEVDEVFDFVFFLRTPIGGVGRLAGTITPFEAACALVRRIVELGGLAVLVGWEGGLELVMQTRSEDGGGSGGRTGERKGRWSSLYSMRRK